MGSIREEVTAVLDRLPADLGELAELDVSQLTTPESFAVLERLEQLRRRLPVPEHTLNQPDRRSTRSANAPTLASRAASSPGRWPIGCT